MKRESIIIKELAIIDRKLGEVTNETAKEALRKKRDRLKAELKDPKQSTNVLAKKLLAEREAVKQLSKVDFNDLIRRLSKKPEYAFLKSMNKGVIRNDIERKAKPVGWRFRGRGNYDKPTKAEIAKGKKSGEVYREVRPRRSDVSFIARLKDGGDITGKYCVVMSGGSIGSKGIMDKKGRKLVETFETREEAATYAKRRNASLSPGEKTYYKMKFYIAPYNEKDFVTKMKDGGRIETLIEEIKMFDKYNHPKPKTKGDKVRAVFKHCQSKGYTTSEINKALGAMKYATGGSMYAGGGDIEDSGLMIKGRTQKDNTTIGEILDENGFEAEWSAREGHWFIPVDVEDYDDTESQLTDLFDENDVKARIEGIFKKGGSMYAGGGTTGDEVIFSVNDETLDMLLHDHHDDDLDYVEIKGDSYYKLNKRDFDRFMDAADSKGFNVDYENDEDAVVYVLENDRYDKGGNILTSDEEKQFQNWFNDGNVIELPDGNYATQDAQYSNRLHSMDEVKRYFKKEFLSYAKGGSMYAGGGNLGQDKWVYELQFYNTDEKGYMSRNHLIYDPKSGEEDLWYNEYFDNYEIALEKVKDSLRKNPLTSIEMYRTQKNSNRDILFNVIAVKGIVDYYIDTKRYSSTRKSRGGEYKIMPLNKFLSSDKYDKVVLQKVFENSNYAKGGTMYKNGANVPHLDLSKQLTFSEVDKLYEIEPNLDDPYYPKEYVTQVGDIAYYNVMVGDNKYLLAIDTKGNYDDKWHLLGSNKMNKLGNSMQQAFNATYNVKQPGSAEIVVELQNGNITVYDGGKNEVLLSLPNVPKGSWDKLFDFFENLKPSAKNSGVAKDVQDWSGEYTEQEIEAVLDEYEKAGIKFPYFFVTVAGPTPEADARMVNKMLDNLPELPTTIGLSKEDIRNISWGIVMAARNMKSAK